MKVAAAVMLVVFDEIPIMAWLLGRYVTAGWSPQADDVQHLLPLNVGAATVSRVFAQRSSGPPP